MNNKQSITEEERERLMRDLPKDIKGRGMACRAPKEGSSAKKINMRRIVDLSILLLIILKIILSISLLPTSPRPQAEAQPSTPVSKNVVVAEQTPEKPTPAEFEISDLLKALDEKRVRLAQEEDALKKEGERLSALKAEIEEKVAYLENLKTEIEALIKKKQLIDEEELARLAKIYDSTPPEAAGPLMDKLDINIAAEIFLRMKDRKAGKIKAFMDPQRAILIDRLIAGRKGEIEESEPTP